MFTLTIRRSCGHEEEVTVESFDPGENLNMALAKIVTEESQKLCGECYAEAQKPMVNFTAKVFIIAVVVTLYILCLFCVKWVIQFG